MHRLPPDWPLSLSWDDAIEAETLIDAHEWAECHGAARPMAMPAAVTATLLDAIESIPFSKLGDERADDRMQTLLARLSPAVERALKRLPPGAPVRFDVDLAIPLTTSRTTRSWQRVRVYCGPNERGEPVVIADVGRS